jgi:hypothetical protein
VVATHETIGEVIDVEQRHPVVPLPAMPSTGLVARITAGDVPDVGGGGIEDIGGMTPVVPLAAVHATGVATDSTTARAKRAA